MSGKLAGNCESVRETGPIVCPLWDITTYSLISSVYRLFLIMIAENLSSYHYHDKTTNSLLYTNFTHANLPETPHLSTNTISRTDLFIQYIKLWKATSTMTNSTRH